MPSTPTGLPVEPATAPRLVCAEAGAGATATASDALAMVAPTKVRSSRRDRPVPVLRADVASVPELLIVFTLLSSTRPVAGLREGERPAGPNLTLFASTGGGILRIRGGGTAAQVVGLAGHLVVGVFYLAVGLVVP